ncbi:hypothetical protein MHYMCMPSP_00830 [Hyalomma marginatum]|uniref:Uncharacterized protein n=1 Tax=Hyalomma marginatum TaxID=34627 RepID=A0A8S4C0I9_9ACAR|nr:hypothetical protein MHYMCMPASI_00624 [Hyalomma marginatum]CAG7593877.1 hypothetical protein MHYMCMPSP_00830 [Hyalomma marginatum]
MESGTTALQQPRQDRLREIAETELLRNAPISESAEHDSFDDVMILSKAIQL